MQMTGHKTRSVFERYNIVSQGDLFDAARRLDLFTGTVTGTPGVDIIPELDQQPSDLVSTRFHGLSPFAACAA